MSAPRRYRTRQETIDLFNEYACTFRRMAQNEEGSKRDFYLGKSEAYETAAFELENNMEGIWRVY